MPRQDPLGRWVSDDGSHVWDGVAWRPVPGRGEPAAQSQVPYYVGAGCAAMILIFVLSATLVGLALRFSPHP